MTTATTPAAAAGQLSSQIVACLDGDRDWDLPLSRLARGQAGLHLAILVEPFCSLLLEGTKTIESRFSRIRCSPYGTLAEGDIVVVKKTGGPVRGAFQAGTVRSYQLTPDRVTELRHRYAAQICAPDDEFWARRADCVYATLVDVTCVRVLPELAFPKKDRRGWVQLTRPSLQETLL
jgi:hypothetical protein